MSRRQQNPNQIIRKDGRNVFVEALRVAFPIEKVQLKFMSYDMNQNKGHRAQDVIDIYLDFAAFLRMSHDIMTGCIYGKLAQEKKAGKPGIMTLYQGGVSTAALAASQKSRPDGKALARKLSVFIGDKYPLCFVAESGPGESIQKGLIAPRWGNKPEHKVVISMSADDVKEFFLMVESEINAYMTFRNMIPYICQTQEIVASLADSMHVNINEIKQKYEQKALPQGNNANNSYKNNYYQQPANANNANRSYGNGHTNNHQQPVQNSSQPANTTYNNQQRSYNAENNSSAAYGNSYGNASKGTSYNNSSSQNKSYGKDNGQISFIQPMTNFTFQR